MQEALSQGKLVVASMGPVSYTHLSLYWIGTIVFLIMAIRGPKTIEKYLYTSGVSNAAHSGIRMLVQTAAMKGMVA